ncbi:hypothetical protein K2173_000895 [Erythroxylum novogranatense]|uniref:Lipase-like PAD4 n=1 Tax=Erythroxylum novogranatense TaxID=1862640 RepID=A0AAV8TQA6_9ROSI|nr:hypothetical protein K2173_000895 [Erythroxylum novogranatense]
MENEASSFETSEMLATFLASTPLLSESWRLCSVANGKPSHEFVIEQIGNTTYVAFCGVQEVLGSPDDDRNWVPFPGVCEELFSPLTYRNDGDDEPVLVHVGLLHIFMSMYNNPDFRNQVLMNMQTSESIVVTGHSVGGTTASLCALWLLSGLRSTSSCPSIFCITFGSPLLGNVGLSRAITRERWGGNFCHVVSKYDLMPRLLLIPIAPIISQICCLVPLWHLCISKMLPLQLHHQVKVEIFSYVCKELQAQPGERSMMVSYWPFGNYFFCSDEGAICVDNATSVIKMMQLLFMMGSPSCCIEDHLKYGEYVRNVCSQFLESRSFAKGEHPELSYDAGVALALQSSGIPWQEPSAGPARDCLKVARRMGRTPNLNCANLAIKLSKITPYRAEIEWYKALCDQSDDQMGYYDSFKQRRASKREFKVNMNRHKLATFWDHVIHMMESNRLPHDFEKRNKWVNASQFYKLLVEPLDIAEYYRTGMHRIKGHYINHGRARRYQIFDRWWEGRAVSGHNYYRSKFASLTQDTLFWARVEESREWLDNVRSQNDSGILDFLWQKLDDFYRHASSLIESKEVSIDVLAKNSSYCLWEKDYKELKSQQEQWRSQLSGFIDGELVL